MIKRGTDHTHLKPQEQHFPSYILTQRVAIYVIVMHEKRMRPARRKPQFTDGNRPPATSHVPDPKSLKSQVYSILKTAVSIVADNMSVVRVGKTSSAAVTTIKPLM